MNITPLEALESLMKDQYQRCNLTSEYHIIEKALKEYEEIKHICSQYDIDFSLVNVREALFTLAQLKGTHGNNWGNYNNKLKVLEFIKENVDISVQEYQGGYYLLVGGDFRGAKPISKETYNLLTEVLA